RRGTGAPRHPPDGPIDGMAGSAWSLRRVEVDHQPDATAGHPHPDADLVEPRVHEVAVVAAVVGALALEVQVRAEDRAVRVARAAAEVLAPAVAGVARTAEAVARGPADEVIALVVDREPLRVRTRDVGADGRV